MARWEFKLPDIGEGVTEGEIVGWLIKAGDLVKEDQPMIEVMTDKATVTITSPKAGSVVETRGKIGDVVEVHSTLVVYELDGEGAAAPAPAATAKKEDGPFATAVGDIKESLPGMGAALAPAAAATTAAVAPDGYFNAKPLATPATRKLARDLQVDLQRVPPTGPHDRVTQKDVERFHQNGASLAQAGASLAQVETSAPPTSASTPKATSAREPVQIAPVSSGAAHGQLEERVPFAGLRRKIAAKMAQSKQTAAHFTFVEECDVTALKALRKRLQPHAEA